MSELKRWFIPSLLSVLLTGGGLFAASRLLDPDRLARRLPQQQSSAEERPVAKSPAAHKQTRPRLSQLGLAPGFKLADPDYHVPSTGKGSVPVDPGDSSADTRKYLAAEKKAPPKAAIKKLLPNLPFRAYSRDPAAAQKDPAESGVPAWVRDDYVTRYPNKE